VYDGMSVGLPRLTDPRFTDEYTRDSGGDIEAPFGGPFQIPKAPDVLAILVGAQDDDREIWDVFSGDPSFIGRRPPDALPDAPETMSFTTWDTSDAIGKFGYQAFNGPFSFLSAQGALYYEVLGHFTVSILDTLGERVITRRQRVIAGRAALVRGGALKAQTRKGGLKLALSVEGRLSRAAGTRSGWEDLPGPRFREVVVHLASDGGQVMAGFDDAGRLHVARVADLRTETPRWRPLDLTVAELPETADGLRHAVHLVATDTRGGLWHVAVEAEGGDEGRLSQVAEGVRGEVVARADGDASLEVAYRSTGGLHFIVIGRDGAVAGQEPLGTEFPIPLGIEEDEAEGLCLLAMDARRRVVLRRLTDPHGAWEVLGTLDEVLQGPLGTGGPSPRPEPVHVEAVPVT
jgi:hypothetical protein